MIGIGKWAGDIQTPIVKGSGIVEIKDKDGSYDFKVTIDNGSDLPPYTVYDIKESGNTLSAKIDTSLLGKTTVDISVTFDGDTFSGYLKVPFFGKVPILNGRRVD